MRTASFLLLSLIACAPTHAQTLSAYLGATDLLVPETESVGITGTLVAHASGGNVTPYAALSGARYDRFTQARLTVGGRLSSDAGVYVRVGVGVGSLSLRTDDTERRQNDTEQFGARTVVEASVGVGGVAAFSNFRIEVLTRALLSAVPVQSVGVQVGYQLN